MRNELLLEVRNVTRVFRTGLYFGASFKAVDDVCLSFTRGTPKVLVVAGESGCGKSTLANMVLGILRPTRGKILYNSKNIVKLKRKERKAFTHDIQPVFQDPYETFNPFHKVFNYLKATALNLGIATSQKQASEVIDKCLQRIGIEPKEVYEKFPHEFSGGQLQRLSIARALVANPSLLVVDEPVSMVDASVRVGILNLLAELVKQYGISIIYITHDLSTAYYLGAQTGGEIIIMYRGSIIEQGLVEKVLMEPAHPYTKMLMEALPDTQKRWKDKVKLPSLELGEFQASGCKFAGRCPQVMERCKGEAPKDISVDDVLVKCFLYS